MKNQIVVSIDPTNIQQNVLEYAEELARAGQKELLIYCVQGMPMLVDMDATMPGIGYENLPGAVAEIEHIGNELLEAVQKRYPNTRLEQGVGFQANATIGKMEELEENEGGSCLLVMPKTTDHGWWDNVLGTTETSVAAEVKCPVLFVPDAAAYKGITRIMYLADSKTLMDGRHKGFRFLRKFADTHVAQIVVGFVFDPQTQEREALKIGEAMDQFKEELPFQFNHEYRFFMHQSPEEILQMAGLTNTDIIAFPFRETPVFKRFFNYEITRTLVLKADIPVLVF